MAIVDILESIGGEGAVRLTELGKIKIGGKGGTKNKADGSGTYRVPEKHDYFTITTLNRNSAGDLVSDKSLMDLLVAGGFGDQDGKLRQIPIRVMSDDIDEILQSSFVWYGGKTVGARSDGKKVTWFVDPETRRRIDPPAVDDWTPANVDWKDGTGKKIFKLHSVFNCVIAAKEAKWGGVYKFRTTSIISFKQMYASLLHIHQLTGGILRGMPLVMAVRPVQVSPDGKATTVHVVHIELRGAELMQIQQQALQQANWMLENKQKMLTVQREYQKLLVAPGHEGEHEAKDISEEFQPETQIIEGAPENYDMIDGDIVPPRNPSPDDGSAARAAELGTGAKPDAGGPATTKAPPTEFAPPPSGETGSEFSDRARDLYAKLGHTDMVAFRGAKDRWVLSLRKKGKEDEIPSADRKKFIEEMEAKAGLFAFLAE